MGYEDRKQARLLLRKMLRYLGASNYDCFVGKYKDAKKSEIMKLCKPYLDATEKADKLTVELYREYPEDPDIIFLYYSYMSTKGMVDFEKEALLKKVIALNSDPHIMAELAYLLIEEKKLNEAKLEFIKILELVSDDYLLADYLERFYFDLRGFGCEVSNEIGQVVNSIPERFKSEFEKHEYEKKVKAKIKPSKDEVEDSKKLAKIRGQVIKGIQQVKCKVSQ